MKKSSILVTLFLVVALVFSVSCPSGPQVSITTTDGKDITKEATVGTALEDFTFDIEVANGAFTADAKDQELTIKGLNQFDAAGTEESAKATAKATITALAVADASTKKVTKATVTVSGFTAKAATQGAKDLTFEIPEVKADGKKFLEDTTSAVAIGGKKVSITAINPTKNVEVVASKSVLDDITEKTTTAQTVTFTISPEGATWKDGSLPTITTDNGITFSFARTSATVLTLTVTPSADTVVAAEKAYEFDITNTIVDIATGSNIVIPANYKAGIKVTVKAAPTPAKTDITINSSVSDPITVSKATKTATASFTIADGATWTTTVPTIPEADGLTFAFTVNTDNKKLDLTITTGDTAVASETAKPYEVTLVAANVSCDDTHKLADNAKLSFQVKITD